MKSNFETNPPHTLAVNEWPRKINAHEAQRSDGSAVTQGLWKVHPEPFGLQICWPQKSAPRDFRYWVLVVDSV
eukprot:2796784-Amphidinium_carterae.1